MSTLPTRSRPSFRPATFRSMPLRLEPTSNTHTDTHLQQDPSTPQTPKGHQCNAQTRSTPAHTYSRQINQQILPRTASLAAVVVQHGCPQPLGKVSWTGNCTSTVMCVGNTGQQIPATILMLLAPTSCECHGAQLCEHLVHRHAGAPTNQLTATQCVQGVPSACSGTCVSVPVPHHRSYKSTNAKPMPE
jgi:hypothetical protein